VKSTVNDVWREEDARILSDRTGVQVFRPKRHMALSQLIVEECGRSAWVENIHTLSCGDSDKVEAAYENFNQLLENMAASLKLDQEAFRETRYYGELLALLRCVAD
jgi:hypothetical protein